MTSIADITLQAPSVYSYGNYNVALSALVSSMDILHQVRELFAKSRQGTSVIDVPGSKPLGNDHTEDSVLTRYVDFTHGSKAKDGYYLLIGYDIEESPSARGLEPVIELSLFYLGSESYLQENIVVADMEKTTNDWSG